ncbi:T9SS type A sorting domain-containing protein [candidate division TA06 bacterium]|uniref:T9SS type A sorting domain-containing protein n=1 Tax=candidate division TA06 bacterium TaxID=2250710 RepID=A0A523UN53_UNCT6|nr:MAG: T9SS type A sorting domain-containing protein [candidate division TA06 bacterium]
MACKVMECRYLRFSIRQARLLRIFVLQRNSNQEIFVGEEVNMLRVALLLAAAICLPLSSAATTSMSFTDITDSTTLGDTAHAYGISLGDYNDDDKLDIFVGNLILPSKLFRNEGDMDFTDVTDSAGFEGVVEAKGSSMADYDNDGDLDLALTGWGRDSFYRNNGDGTFIDYTDSANYAVDDSVHGMSVVWADYDGDGYVDLFVANLDGPSILYRNQGDGTFSDVTSDAGIDSDYGTGALWLDYDDDGDPDLFVGRYSGKPDHLYRNDGDSTFTEVGDSAGLAHDDSTFGCVAGDIDGDGDLDLFVARFGGASALYENDGDGTFTDITDSAGVSMSGAGTGCAFEDFDSDGDLDLYVGRFLDENYMFENDGTGSFTDVTADAGVGDAGTNRTGVGITAGDLDGDGDVDIYCGNHKRNTLFRNDTETSLLAANNWMVLRLHGSLSNRSAIGARVYLTTPAGTQVREVTGGSGVCSMSSLQLEFGLGPHGGADIVIRWPSGYVENRAIFGGGYVDIEEGVTGVVEGTAHRSIRQAVLLQNRPNPFSSRTLISYQIAARGPVAIDIYDIAGRLVCNLVNGEVNAGTHTVLWDGTVSGKAVSDGVYICRLSGEGFALAQKIVLLK